MNYLMFLSVVVPDCQQAWIWLPVLILLGGGGLVGAIIAALTSTEGTKLGIIGMKGAGKTTYLSHLGLVEKDDGTPVTPYKAKTVHVGNRDMEIAAGEDIGGEDEYVRFYKPWLVGAEKKDIIVFIFDGYKYLNNNEYKRDTCARLDFIYKNYRQANANVKDFKNIVLIASHLDQYKGKDIKQMKNDILKSVAGKEYCALFKNNFSPIDLRDKELINKVNAKIFD